MDFLIELLKDNGSLGMFLAGILSGSVIPFSSEAVMLGLLAAGADPIGLLLWGTIGNSLGSLINYGIGTLGREEWISRWTKVPPEKLERGKRWVHQYGSLAGLLAWLPLIGSVITVSLGFLRVNMLFSILTITIGKFLRYWALIAAYVSV